jgi:hypothetical protein
MSAMDVGAVKAPRFGGAKDANDTTIGLDIAKSVFKFTALMRQAM